VTEGSNIQGPIVFIPVYLIDKNKFLKKIDDKFFALIKILFVNKLVWRSMQAMQP